MDCLCISFTGSHHSLISYIQRELTLIGQSKGKPSDSEVHSLDTWKADTNAHMKKCLPCLFGEVIFCLYFINIALENWDLSYKLKFHQRYCSTACLWVQRGTAVSCNLFLSALDASAEFSSFWKRSFPHQQRAWFVQMWFSQIVLPIL